MAWPNGRIPADQLRACDGTPGAMLLPVQAASWNAVRAEVHRRFGWWPTITSAGDAYRSYDRQVVLFTRNYSTRNTGVDRRTWNGQTWWRVPGYPSAATPGTSNHGKGVTVDVSGLGSFGSTRHRQFSQVAKAAGWSDAEGRRISEPWHWNGHNAVAPVSNGGSIGGTVPTPPPTTPIPDIQEDIMASLDDLRSVLAPIAEAVQGLRDQERQYRGVPQGVQALTDATARHAAYTATGPDGQTWLIDGVLRRPITEHQRDVLSTLAPPATVPYLGGISDDALAAFADIGGETRPVARA